MTTEYTLGDWTRAEVLYFLGLVGVDDPKIAAIASLSWGGNALKVLRVNATENGWELVASAPLTDGNKGDVTVSSSGASFTINGHAVTFPKFVAASAASIVGATAAGDFSELTPSSARSVLGLNTGDSPTFAALTVTGAITATGTGVDASTIAFRGTSGGSTDATGLRLWDTDDSHTLRLLCGSDLTANRRFAIKTGDANRTLDISDGNVTISIFGASLTDDADAATARTTLGVVPGTDVFKQRTITGTANEITVANGDGVSANPTLSLPAALTFTGKTVTGGTFSGIALNGTNTGSGSLSLTNEISALKFSVGSQTEQGVDPAFVSKRSIDNTNVLPGMAATPGARGYSVSDVVNRGGGGLGPMAVAGYEFRSQFIGGYNLDHVNGFQCNPFLFNTGTHTDFRAYQIAPMFWDGIWTTVTGVYHYALDRLPGNYLGATALASITTVQAIYIEALGHGTTRYAFRSAGADDQVSIAGHTDVQNWIRASGNANPFTTGKGVEVFYNTTADAGGINCYDRTGSAYKPLYIDASTITMRVAGSDVGTISSTGYSFTGTVTVSSLTASQLVATNGSKVLQSLTTATYPSLTEIAYVKGVTSAIQTQIDGKQPLDSDLTTIAGLTATTDNFIVSVSSAWASRTPAQVRTTLGLVIGTNVQAWDADLDTIAGLTATTDNFIVSVSSAWASRTPAQVRTTLGLVIGTNVQAWDADLDAVASSGIAAAWTSWTPTVTSGAGTITSYTSSGGYKIIGKTLWYWATVTITNAGTGAGALLISNLPGTATVRQFGAGGEDAVSGHQVQSKTTASATTLSSVKYDATTFIATNARMQTSGTVEVS